MSEKQKEWLETGCVGIVEVELNKRFPPDYSDAYDDFNAALNRADELEGTLEANQRVVIYALEFYSKSETRHKAKKGSHKVNLQGWNRNGHDGKGDKKGHRWGNYNYTLYDRRRDTWWGANQTHDPEKGRIMTIERKITLEVIGSYDRERFNRQVFCVSITTVP